MRLIWNLWNLTLFLWLHKELRLCMHKCYRLFPLLFSFIHSSLAMYTHSKKKLFLRSFMHMIFTYEILTLRSISVDCIFSFFILSVSMLSSYCFLLFSYAWFEMWCLFEDNNVSDYHLFLNRSKKRRKRSSGRNVCPLSERATFFLCATLFTFIVNIKLSYDNIWKRKSLSFEDYWHFIVRAKLMNELLKHVQLKNCYWENWLIWRRRISFDIISL